MKRKKVDFMNHVWLNSGGIGCSNNATLRPWYDPHDTDANNRRAQRAYEALLTVTARVPDTDQYMHFSNEVKRIARDEFNYTFLEEPVNPFVAAFHEAVLLYAIALNETLEAGGTVTNGTAITSRMWGRTFTGKYIHFLINGDLK